MSGVILARRSFLVGLGSLMAAPAIVQASGLMRIKEYAPEVPAWCPDGWLPLDGREISKKWYPDLARAYEQMRYPLKLGDRAPIHAPIRGYETFSESKANLKGYSVISYRDMRRPNGALMRAGATHRIFVSDA